MSKIKVVDLFAGPGGLGEGFARFSPDGSVQNRPFQIVCSAEKDPAAVKTLRLRTFFRLCEDRGEVPQSYFDYVQGKVSEPYDTATRSLWQHACKEASTIELGTEAGDRELRAALKRNLEDSHEWVLIGGPPCQAYSLVGRSRNRGIADYDAVRDRRNFLYEHYLEILARHRPSVFIMENVKGLLSSRVGNEQMFPRILKDLTNPGRAVGTRKKPKYIIHALATSTAFAHGDEIENLDPPEFIIRSEKYGIPQARHRVILLGIRQDAGLSQPMTLQPRPEPLDSWMALRTLPELRSGITKYKSTTSEWQSAVIEALKDARRNGLSTELHDELLEAFRSRYQNDLHQGGRFVKVSRVKTGATRPEKKFLESIINPNLGGYPNHQARNHMPMDLVRYLYASTVAQREGASPKASDFPAALAPNHRNWNSGKFADRFRVQVQGRPSTTVTSHISKDGHYFIHPEPHQCRSLTVREAARLQTFPDDYFFEGNRTEQYVQTGNAVPPMLAENIAQILWGCLKH